MKPMFCMLWVLAIVVVGCQKTLSETPVRGKNNQSKISSQDARNMAITEVESKLDLDVSQTYDVVELDREEPNSQEFVFSIRDKSQARPGTLIFIVSVDLRSGKTEIISD